MGYSEAAVQGVKVNGKKWKATIKGMPSVMADIRAALADQNVERIDAGLREIAAKFRPHMDKVILSFGERDDLEWFEEESCAYEAENGELQDWVKEFDYRMKTLYDFADFQRIWVDPN